MANDSPPTNERRIGRDQIAEWVTKLITPGRQTIGDNYNCLCPYCGRNNTYVADKVPVVLGEVITMEQNCRHCERPIFYQIEYAIKVTAKAPGVTG
jgi:hypothetical protein